MLVTAGQLQQVGPVLVPPALSEGMQIDDRKHEGGFIAAGYTGHGMPRAYGSYVTLLRVF
jgi:hypothetical protein